MVKNYARWGDDGKMLMGKIVSADFRELNKKTHAKPGRGDIIAGVIKTITTDARYAKAVQHLRDSGQLDQSPRDIGPLMKEVQQDIEAEAVDEIKDALWLHFRKDILRGASRDLPAWYKNELLQLQFPEEQEQA